MQEVRCEYFERTGPELRQRTGRRFLVLPECEEPFKRELNGLMALRLLVKKYERSHWLVRLLWASDGVYLAQFFIDRRHHSYWQTIKFALRVAIVFCSPDWLQVKLAQRWARDYKQEAEDRNAIQWSYEEKSGKVTIIGQKGKTRFACDIDLSHSHVTDVEHARAVGRQLIERRFTQSRTEPDVAPTPGPSLPSGPSPETY